MDRNAVEIGKDSKLAVVLDVKYWSATLHLFVLHPNFTVIECDQPLSPSKVDCIGWQQMANTICISSA